MNFTSVCHDSKHLYQAYSGYDVTNLYNKIVHKKETHPFKCTVHQYNLASKHCTFF